MFINFSNHPSANWPPKQRAAAESLGEVKDIAFPSITPELSENDIIALVDTYLKKYPWDTADPVFLAGEYCFAFAMTDLLLSRGVRALCTESNLKLVSGPMENGTTRRTATLEFLRFTNYAVLPDELTVIGEKNRVFLNCSANYPSDMWDENATREAETYGKVTDMPIKMIEGETFSERFAKAREYLARIDEIRPSAILLDGAFWTFYLMADALLRKGYTVLVKCSRRIVVEKTEENGEIVKNYEYHFVRYRQIKRYKEK